MQNVENTKICNTIYCVCVLIGLQDEQCDQITRWFFRASVSDCSIIVFCRLLLCTLPCPYWYYNFHHSYHTSSYAHLGVSRLGLIISVFRRRSLSHLGVSCLRTIILTSQPALSLYYGSYIVALYPPLLLLLASRESSRLAQSYFSDASWLHQASIMRPTPSYYVSLANTPNIGHTATHWSTFACCLPM